MNKYLIEAMDSYPYDLTQTVESLEYALSYDDRCPHALCLYGRVYAEQLQEYDKAIDYFEEALQSNLYAIKVYPYYIQTLLQNEAYDKALKAIDFAMKIKGMDKGKILFAKALCFERQMDYETALKCLVESEIHSFDDDFKDLLAEVKQRIENKKSPKKSEKTKKKKG